MKPLTAVEVSRLLRVRVETVTRYARQGSIPAIRVGGAWRFDSGRIQAWLNNGGARQNAATPAPKANPPDDDPVLKVIGIGADGRLSRNIDPALYGRRR